MGTPSFESSQEFVNQLKGEYATGAGLWQKFSQTFTFLLPVIAVGAGGALAGARLFGGMGRVAALGSLLVDEICSAAFTALWGHWLEKRPSNYVRDLSEGVITRLPLLGLVQLFSGGSAGGRLGVLGRNFFLMPMMMAVSGLVSEVVVEKEKTAERDLLSTAVVWNLAYRFLSAGVLMHLQSNLLLRALPRFLHLPFSLHADDWFQGKIAEPPPTAEEGGAGRDDRPPLPEGGSLTIGGVISPDRIRELIAGCKGKRGLEIRIVQSEITDADGIRNVFSLWEGLVSCGGEFQGITLELHRQRLHGSYRDRRAVVTLEAGIDLEEAAQTLTIYREVCQGPVQLALPQDLPLRLLKMERARLLQGQGWIEEALDLHLKVGTGAELNEGERERLRTLERGVGEAAAAAMRRLDIWWWAGRMSSRTGRLDDNSLGLVTQHHLVNMWTDRTHVIATVKDSLLCGQRIPAELLLCLRGFLLPSTRQAVDEASYLGEDSLRERAATSSNWVLVGKELGDLRLRHESSADTLREICHELIEFGAGKIERTARERKIEVAAVPRQDGWVAVTFRLVGVSPDLTFHTLKDEDPHLVVAQRILSESEWGGLDGYRSEGGLELRFRLPPRVVVRMDEP